MPQYEFGPNGVVLGVKSEDAIKRPRPKKRKRNLRPRKHFWLRLVLAGVLSGPLNLVGLLAGLFWVSLNGWDSGAFTFAINAYCSVGTLFGLFFVAGTPNEWSTIALERLAFKISGILYLITFAVMMVFIGAHLFVLVLFAGLVLWGIIGFPAALIGVHIVRLIVFAPVEQTKLHQSHISS